MGAPRRAFVQPDKVIAPGVVTHARISAHERAVRERRMRLALEQIAKLDSVFDDEPANAARAAVAIAKEALK